MSRLDRVVLMAIVVGGVSAQPAMRAQETSSPDSRQRLERLEERRQRVNMRLGRRPGGGGTRALYAPTVSGGPSPQALPSPVVSLSIQHDFDLGRYVFHDGTPFIHTYGGADYSNTAVGLDAMTSLVLGNPDYFYAEFNTAVGVEALGNTMEGGQNTAVGAFALSGNTTGYGNTAVGIFAGTNWTTGTDNIAIGGGAYGDMSDTGTIRIGGEDLQTRTLIEGIRGAAYPPTYYFDETVCTNSLNQLGPCGGPSSARFKDGIQEMRAVSEALDSLQPVTFHYKKRTLEADGPPHYGLIAEEVAKVFPHMVRYDEEGKPYSIRYELLTPMLLKDLQDEKQRREAEVEDLRQQVAELRKVVGDLKGREEIQRE